MCSWPWPDSSSSFVCEVAAVANRRVFLLEPVHRRADLVLVPAALRFDGVRQHRLGELDARERDGVDAIAERVVGERVLQLCDGAEISSLDFRHARLCLALQQQQVTEALGGVARLVVTIGVRLQRARHHAKHRDAACKWIRDGLPDERRRRQLFVGRASRLRPILGQRAERPVDGRGQIREDGVEQLRHADVDERRRADEREQLADDRRRAQARDEFRVGQRPGLEELLHQFLVVLGDHFDECFARRIDVGLHACGTAPSANLPLSSVWNVNAFFVTRSTMPLKFFSSPMGS